MIKVWLSTRADRPQRGWVSTTHASQVAIPAKGTSRSQASHRRPPRKESAAPSCKRGRGYAKEPIKGEPLRYQANGAPSAAPATTHHGRLFRIPADERASEPRIVGQPKTTLSTISRQSPTCDGLIARSLSPVCPLRRSYPSLGSAPRRSLLERQLHREDQVQDQPQHEHPSRQLVVVEGG